MISGSHFDTILVYCTNTSDYLFMKKIGFWMFLVVAFFAATVGCENLNQEELFPVETFECDPATVTFEAVVKPIIDTNCAIAGCHVPGTGRVNLQNFDVIVFNREDIRTRVITRDMPRAGLSLTSLEVNQIVCWIDSGAQDN